MMVYFLQFVCRNLMIPLMIMMSKFHLTKLIQKTL